MLSSERFTLIRRIGAGGMGVVYDAYDKERNTRVALKTLTALEPQSLYLFKKEFRSLANISHENLVALYELFCEDGQWFFTMEFIEGTNWLEYVSPGTRLIPTIEADPCADLEITWSEGPTVVPGEFPADEFLQGGPAPVSRCDFHRLRGALTQLAEAVLTLHAAGVVHRDLKPLNVMVTHPGRVVVLDFGLVAEITDRQSEAQPQNAVVGSVAYMSPEQAAGVRPTEATDWYSVGVMLYKALTHGLPFYGEPGAVLWEKQHRDPLPPSTVTAGIPEYLSELCAALLRRDPGERLGGRDLLARLSQSGRVRAATFSHAVPAADGTVFVGRETQLVALGRAFDMVESGAPAAVLVCGKSGIGKSALVEHFLERFSKRSDVVVLRGRCYEQESVPYKAFDSIVDALTRYAAGLPRHESAELMPRDVFALARVFPALRQIAAVADAPSRTGRSLDEFETRRKAFGAFRELLARLGDRRRLVLYIDDLQWGDFDSALLLKEILRGPEPPLLLFLGAYRAEYTHKSPLLHALLGEPAGDVWFRGAQLELQPLTEEESCMLAARLLPAETASLWQQAAHVAREAGGSPYFLRELIGQFGAGALDPAQEPLSLDAVLWKRVQALPDDARRLLEVVAVSARPLALRDAYEAAQLEAQDPKITSVLRSASLISSSGTGEHAEVEAYHDRVRETVAGSLDYDTLQRHHLNLALALEAAGCPDAETIAVHYEGAGRHSEAGRCYATAAARAAAALAFKHAARLYQCSLQLRPVAGEEGRELRTLLADALANAGRGAEAARAYREASQGAPQREAFELQRRAAYWFACSGYVDEGRDAFAAMLARANLKLPATPARTLLALLAAKLHLRLRGVGFRERAESEVPRNQLEGIDVAWDAARGFSLIDIPNGMYFNARSLLLALRAGEIKRVAQALIWEAVTTTSFAGPMPQPDVDQWLAIGAVLTERAGSAYLRGLLALGQGVVALMRGDCGNAVGRLEDAEAVLRQECTGVAWELATASQFRLLALREAGAYAELCRRAVVCAGEAEERGDLYLATGVGCWVLPFNYLIAGEPDLATRTLDRSLQAWTCRYYHVQHAGGALSRVWTLLYRGEGTQAWKFIDHEWPLLSKNHYLSVNTLRQYLYYAHAEAAISASATAPDGASLLRAAERDARVLEGDRRVASTCVAKLIRAGCAARRGQRDAAILLLEQGAAACADAGRRMLAIHARRQLGEYLGGATGRAMAMEADVALRAEGVADPARLTAVYLNGFST